MNFHSMLSFGIYRRYHNKSSQKVVLLYIFIMFLHVLFLELGSRDRSKRGGGEGGRERERVQERENAK